MRETEIRMSPVKSSASPPPPQHMFVLCMNGCVYLVCISAVVYNKPYPPQHDSSACEYE